ncbi:hypothetical protein K402DRAFT_438651 [Aulographum hederae CBS 113979]|uniref:Mitochondrial zinc maintenance protein 1, mitochondrial n=1 Tax=Aulographum hederae CBS 113979 TaxID=1176131 RepID=A0A6G1GNG8_9PEZI|nr:hypothetical protein K402DRAFT_438651 [Aulographum hederae CBS 113979]
MALPAYRHLLRSARIAFQGDTIRLSAALSQARAGFEMNRNLPSSSPEAAQQITHAEDVARILRENLVQGQAMDEAGDRYKLNIHEHTERGDNETIKLAGMVDSAKNLSTGAGKCCSA